MGRYYDDSDDDSDVMDLTRNIMMVSIIALFILTLFFLFLHLYSKWYWYRLRQSAPAAMDSRQQKGLDASFLKIIQFHSNDFGNGLECAICLSEVEEGEKIRILPKCSHGFHMECIDMWFHSHSTCPICRNEISQQQSPIDDNDVLMNNNHHQEDPLSSSSSSSLPDRGIRPDLVIDIPTAQINGEEEEEEEEEQVVVSSSSRCSSGMRSLKRIFSPGTSSNAKSCPFTP